MKLRTHGDFYGKLAPVNKGKTWSFVDKSGKEVRTGFKAIMHNNITHLWAGQNASDVLTVFDEQNQDVPALSNYAEVRFPSYEGGKEVFAVRKQTQWGAVSRSGEVILPFGKYQEISSSFCDFIAVKKDEKWGAVTPAEEELVPIRYDDIYPPAAKDEQDIWVICKEQDNKGLFYHYNLQTKVQGTTAYVTAFPFVREQLWHCLREWLWLIIQLTGRLCYCKMWLPLQNGLNILDRLFLLKIRCYLICL